MLKIKQISSILLSALILFLSVGFQLSSHYCGEDLVSTSLTIDGKAEGCGMEAELAKSDCNQNSKKVSKKSCCLDNVTALEIEDDYQPSSEFEFEKADIHFTISFVYSYFKSLLFDKQEFEFNEYSPPALAQNILVEHQVFRI